MCDLVWGRAVVQRQWNRQATSSEVRSGRYFFRARENRAMVLVQPSVASSFIILLLVVTEDDVPRAKTSPILAQLAVTACVASG